MNSIESYSQFWNNRANIAKYPNIRNLALILLGIPASSAVIERFFQCAGFMSKNHVLLNLIYLKQNACLELI